MWWVIIIIFFCGLLLSTGTFLLQYFGYCPTTPALAGAWPSQYAHRGLQVRKEEGLPAAIVQRLKSYQTVADVPFKLVPLEAEEPEDTKEEAECLICQEEMSKERVSQLSCGHIFHKSCISSWLQRKASCPTCRKAITEESIESSGSVAVCSPDLEMAVMKRENDSQCPGDLQRPAPDSCTAASPQVTIVKVDPLPVVEIPVRPAGEQQTV